MNNANRLRRRGNAMDGDRYDLIIGGGSFVGLAIALGLAKSAPGAFRIAVVERMPVAEARAGQFDGRTVALTTAARHMLEALGIWDGIGADAQPVLLPRSSRLWQDRAGCCQCAQQHKWQRRHIHHRAPNPARGAS